MYTKSLVLVNAAISLLMLGGLTISCMACYASYNSGENITLAAIAAIALAVASMAHAGCHVTLAKAYAPKWVRVYHTIMAIAMIAWPIYMGILTIDNLNIVNY